MSISEKLYGCGAKAELAARRFGQHYYSVAKNGVLEKVASKFPTEKLKVMENGVERISQIKEAVLHRAEERFPNGTKLMRNGVDIVKEAPQQTSAFIGNVLGRGSKTY